MSNSRYHAILTPESALPGFGLAHTTRTPDAGLGLERHTIAPCKTPRSALKGDSSRDTVPPHRLPVAEGIPQKQEGHLTPLQNCVEECQGYSRGADRPQFNRGEAIEQPRLNHKEGL